jgi:hypothetical protein
LDAAFNAGLVAHEAIEPDAKLDVLDEIHVAGGGIGQRVFHAADGERKIALSYLEFTTPPTISDPVPLHPVLP